MIVASYINIKLEKDLWWALRAWSKYKACLESQLQRKLHKEGFETLYCCSEGKCSSWNKLEIFSNPYITGSSIKALSISERTKNLGTLIDIVSYCLQVPLFQSYIGILSGLSFLKLYMHVKLIQTKVRKTVRSNFKLFCLIREIMMWLIYDFKEN